MEQIDIEKWKKNWLDKKIALWGYGKTCRTILKNFKTSTEVECIIDNDKEKNGTVVNETPVIHPDYINLHEKKIVVTTYYNEISKQLKNAGLVENVDFCDIRNFLSLKDWYKNKKVCLYELHMAITTACTLNCKYCNMYMPFHKKHAIIYTFEEIKEQIDCLFTYVDRIVRLVLLGGEPLINKDIDKIINYLYEKYHNRFDILTITTNGTIIPNEDTIDAIKKSNTVISISDYNLNDSYSEKLINLKNILDQNRIESTINKSLEWKDFSFPYNPLNLSEKQSYINMNKCNPIFRGFNDNKFYFCHIVWSADKAGLFKEQPTDFINFLEPSECIKEKIVMMDNCCYEDYKFNALCQKCGGCSELNQKFISVGEQLT